MVAIIGPQASCNTVVVVFSFEGRVDQRAVDALYTQPVC